MSGKAIGREPVYRWWTGLCSKGHQQGFGFGIKLGELRCYGERGRGCAGKIEMVQRADAQLNPWIRYVKQPSRRRRGER